MANSENIKLFKRCEGIGTEFEMTTSFITPEITDIDTDLLLKYLDENNELKRYERLIKEIIENMYKSSFFENVDLLNSEKEETKYQHW